MFAGNILGMVWSQGEISFETNAFVLDTEMSSLETFDV